ncbi:MAG: N-acetylmuramoyl-L-alanine amidase [Lachnospiraceae bacterium]|jgi:N-acetylmuramoyl-L-alanine amidase|nr:N-acetylmuramoyl-L-alanine amidase [Lachnospiraceae bacterium]
MKKPILYAIIITGLLFVPLLLENITTGVFSAKRNTATVIIDVGHGGNDPGKVSTDGIKEKDINLEIANYLKEYLIAQDFVVYMTRNDDYGLYDETASNKKRSDLNNRIRLVSEKKADIVISIHQNSYPDSAQHGAQTFYYKGRDNDKQLAECIQDSLLSFDPTNQRLAKDNDGYYLLKNCPAPAVIVECGFLSNPEETAKLIDSNYQKDLAYAISIGVCKFQNKQ